MQGACSRGENRQKMHLSGSHPSPSGALVTHRETPTLIGGDLEGYTKSEKLMLHTHSEQHVHSCSAYWESFRETLYLLKLSEALAGCGKALNKRDLVLLGEESMEI